jgi:hypothetical protein
LLEEITKSVSLDTPIITRNKRKREGDLSIQPKFIYSLEANCSEYIYMDNVTLNDLIEADKLLTDEISADDNLYTWDEIQPPRKKYKVSFEEIPNNKFNHNLEKINATYKEIIHTILKSDHPNKKAITGNVNEIFSRALHHNH